VNRQQHRLLQYLATHGAQTVHVLAAWRGCSLQSMYESLHRLHQRGLLTWVRTLGTHPRRWLLTPAGWQAVCSCGAGDLSSP